MELVTLELERNDLNDETEVVILHTKSLDCALFRIIGERAWYLYDDGGGEREPKSAIEVKKNATATFASRRAALAAYKAIGLIHGLEILDVDE